MPRVSVVIPNYNHSAYLKQRIDSVLNQTFQDFEVIILDDCSNDNSEQIIETYRNHPKISHILYNKINSGSTFRQWDKGISCSKGEWIWMAESDDWCEPTFLESIVPVVMKHNNCVLGYCQSYCILDENEIKFQSFHNKLSEFIDGKQFIKEYIITKNPIFNASMAVWKKEAYTKISKDFMKYRLCGDWLFWLELCSHGDVFMSGKMLNYFRKHEKDVSGRAFRSGLNFIEGITILNDLYKRKLLDQAEYINSLKRNYFSFKTSKRGFERDTVLSIERLFPLDFFIQLDLKLYFIQKYIRSFLRKILKL